MQSELKTIGHEHLIKHDLNSYTHSVVSLLPLLFPLFPLLLFISPAFAVGFSLFESLGNTSA